MLFDKVKKTAPTSLSIKAKASFNAVSWTKVTDDQFVEYVGYRYTSALNATTNTAPVEVYRGPDRKFHDVNADGGMTQDSDYWYRVSYIDIYGNESQLATAVTTKYSGQKSSDLVGQVADSQVAGLTASKLIGQLVGSQLQNGIIDTSKLASGIAAVEIVSALPSSGNFTGRQVFLTSDKKLYRYDGSAWTATVATSDLTGTLAAAQFSNVLRPVEVLAALPGTGNFDGRLVFLTTDKKLYRYDGGANTFTKAVDGNDLIANSVLAGSIKAGEIVTTHMTAGSINADRLVAGSITTGLMTAGSINADRLVANSITAGLISAGAIVASKIAVGTFSDNLILDGDFESADLAAWNKTNGTFTIDTTSTPPSGGKALKMDRGVTNNTVTMNAVWNQYIPVQAGDTYYGEFTIKGSTASAGGAYLRINYYDANKTNFTDPATGNTNYDFYANGAITTSYVTLKGSKVIPAGVKYITLQIYHHSTSTAQSLFVSNVVLKKAITGDVIVNGTITASHIASYNLTAANATFGNVDISAANIGTLQVGTINITNGAVTSGKTDQTLPAALTVAPVGGQLTVDVDLDGRADIAVQWTWTKPPTDTSNPVVGYQVNIFEGGTKVETKLTGDLVAIYKGKAGKSYSATVQTMGFNGKMSAVGTFGTSNTVNTLKKSAISGNASWNVAGFTVNQGISVALLKWTRCTQPDYLETHAFRYPTLTDANNNTNATDIGSVNANWLTDSDPALVVGTQYWYRIQHYDRSQNPGPLSGVQSVIIRGISVKDMLTPDSTNLLQDPNMEDVSAWIVNNAGSSFGIIRELNSGANGYSKYRLHVQGNGVELRTPYIMVDPGETYYVECWAGTLGTSATLSVFTNEFSYDGTGTPVYTGATTAVGSSGVSAMQLFTFTFTPSAPLIKLEFNTQGTTGVRDLYVASPIIRRMNKARDYGDLTIPNAAYKATSITLDKMANNAVDSNVLASGAVGHGHLQDLSVDTNNLRANSVTNTQLAANAVNSGQVVDGAITFVKLASNVFNNGIAAMGAGALGTYAFLKNIGAATVGQGSTTAGSNLALTDTALATGATVSGTWMAMSRCTVNNGSVFLRVS